MKRRLALLALVALGLFAGAASAREEGFQLMPMDQVEKSLGPGLHVFDVNTPELWAKHRLPGAVHVTGKDLGPLLPPDHGARLVFYCSNQK
jgi:rhodanese-related sulfurtransferase